MTKEIKTFDLNIDYKLIYPATMEKPSDEEQAKAHAELTRDYIEFAITYSHKEGLNSQYRRIYAGLRSKIDTALEDKTYSIEITDSEIKFIKDALLDENTKFNATIAKYVISLEDAILGL